MGDCSGKGLWRDSADAGDGQTESEEVQALELLKVSRKALFENAVLAFLDPDIDTATERPWQTSLKTRQASEESGNGRAAVVTAVADCRFRSP